MLAFTNCSLPGVGFTGGGENRKHRSALLNHKVLLLPLPTGGAHLPRGLFLHKCSDGNGDR